MKNINIIRVGTDSNVARDEDIKDIQAACLSATKLTDLVPSTKTRNGEIECNLLTISCSPDPGVLIVRIGSDHRPATIADIEDVQKSLSDMWNSEEPLILVTHHNFEVEWVPIVKKYQTSVIVTNHKNTSMM